MQMARAWKMMLRCALLVALGASTAHAAVTNVYYEDFESWSNGVGIAAQDPTHWTNWTWTGDALVTSTLDAHSNATKALDVQGQDMNLYLPGRLFDGVTSNSAANDDATHMQISMDVWLVQDDILDFMISDYQRPPTNFDYYDHPGSGFEISGTGGYGAAGANGFYGAAGPHGNILTFISFGTYLGWGFDYFHKDYDPGVKGGAWHHVLMDMKLDPTSIDASGDMPVYTQWWLNGTNLFANGFPSADRSYTGVPVAGSEGSNVWSGAYSKINASAVWGTGGVQSAEIFGWVGQSNVFVDNILVKQGNWLEIVPKLTNTCANYQTCAWLRLTAGSYWGTSGVSWTYTNSAGLSAGLSNVNFSSTNYFYFNPSNSTPGTYEVRAWAVDQTNCQDVATVNVVKVDIKKDGVVITGATTNVIDGQRINLQGVVEPAGLMISTNQWAIQNLNETIADWSVVWNGKGGGDGTGSLEARILPLTNLVGASVAFYWVDGAFTGSLREVKYKVDFSGTTFEATTTLRVFRPQATLNNVTNDCVHVDSTNYTALHPGHWVHYGFGDLGTPNGVQSGATITIPAGFSSYTYDPGYVDGAIWVQLLWMNRQLRSGTNWSEANSGEYVLDVEYPYDWDTTVTPPVYADSPAQSLASGGTLVDEAKIVTESFQTWLMWRPEGADTNTIPIPLKRLDWNWSAHVERSGSMFSLTSSSAEPPTVQETTVHPEWTKYRYSDMFSSWPNFVAYP